MASKSSTEPKIVFNEEKLEKAGNTTKILYCRMINSSAFLKYFPLPLTYEKACSLISTLELEFSADKQYIWFALLMAGISFDHNRISIYEFPTFELIETLKSIILQNNFTTVETWAAGCGLLEYYLNESLKSKEDVKTETKVDKVEIKVDKVEIKVDIKAYDDHSWFSDKPVKYYPIGKKSIKQCLKDHSDKTIPDLIIVSWLYKDCEKDLTKGIKDKKIKNMILIGEDCGSCYSDDFLKCLNDNGYKTKQIYAKQICHNDYIVSDKIKLFHNKKNLQFRSRILLISKEELKTKLDEKLIIKIVDKVPLTTHMNDIAEYNATIHQDILYGNLYKIPLLRTLLVNKILLYLKEKIDISLVVYE